MTSQELEKENLNQQEKKQKGPQGPKGPSKYTKEFIEKEADRLLEWIQKKDNLFLNGFSRSGDYEACRLQEFARSNKKFSEALRKAKDIQEDKIVKMSMSKDVDMTWVKYFLPRMLQDRPHWKSSWDQQEQNTVIQTPNVTINKITRSVDTQENVDDIES